MPPAFQTPELWVKHIFILYKVPAGLRYSVITTGNRLSKQELPTGNRVGNTTLHDCIRVFMFTSVLTWYQSTKKSCPQNTVFTLPFGIINQRCKIFRQVKLNQVYFTKKQPTIQAALIWGMSPRTRIWKTGPYLWLENQSTAHNSSDGQMGTCLTLDMLKSVASPRMADTHADIDDKRHVPKLGLFKYWFSLHFAMLGLGGWKQAYISAKACLQ